MEDLHWVDPTTLELLTLLVDQGPTARILALWTFRPDFSPPWTGRSHLTQVTLPRLPRRQATEMTGRVAHGKALPAEVVAQVVAKTDGVPLFVEELTKMVLESGLLQEREERYELTGPLPPLAIPTTLHDSLMARLDRLATVKSLAQLGATLGREFSYELLQAVSPWDEETLQRGLHQLVEAEFLYQRGLPPQATYLFKHALIQDAAYQSLLKSTRQQYHQRIAQVLEAAVSRHRDDPARAAGASLHRGGAARTGHPLLAARRASVRSSAQRTWKRSPTLLRGSRCSPLLPDTPARTQQELVLQLALGPVLIGHQGQCGPRGGSGLYPGACACASRSAIRPITFRCFVGLWRFYADPGRVPAGARAGRSSSLTWRQRARDAALRLEAQRALGMTLFYLGESRGCPLAPGAGHEPLRPPAAPSPCCAAMAVTLAWTVMPMRH